MNFVIVAPSFYPKCDAESFCSTRFASALVNAGHSVHVVTWRQEKSAFNNNWSSLCRSAIRVSEVTLEGNCEGTRIGWRWKVVMERYVEDIRPFVFATRKILTQYDRPVLITRCYPMLSLYVGWHCRKHAAKWIAHFSDPMLDFKPWCRLAQLRLWSLKWWMRRAMRHADAISVTCKRVKWYYREQLGPCVDKAKFILATHIGDFKLEGKKELGVRGRELGGRPVIFHDGDIYASRGLQILDAVKNLNEQGFAVDFIQGRAVKNEGERKRILSTPHCFILDKDAPDELRAQAKAAQVSFVADFNTDGLSYSPFLMSKFVYQLFTDKPIVVLSKLESEKHDYCVAYPKAGLFFADLKEPGSLEKAIRAALTADPKTFDRTRIRERFSEERIAAEFIEQLECEDRALLEEKWMGRV